MLEAIKTWFRKRGQDDVKKALLEDPMSDYRQSRFYAAELTLQDLPLFRLWHCFLMETDTTVGFAERIRNAALLQGEIEITATDPAVGKFVREQWDTLWNLHGASLAKTKRYGFSGYQVLFTKRDESDLIEIDDLRVLSPYDVRPRTIGGRVVGIEVKGNQLFMPQGLWTTFDAEGQVYGKSIYRRAYPPWFEKWMDHGAKKVMQQRMIKDAYLGLKGRYPKNEFVKHPDGRDIPWRDYLREMLDNSLAGASMVIPSDTADGKYKFDVEGMTDSGSPEGIYRWIDALDQDIAKGLDVFPEVIQASQTGSGYSGRSLPVAMFLLAVQSEFAALVQAITYMTLEPLAWANFGNADFAIKPKSLLETFAEQMQGSPMGGGAMGGDPGPEGAGVPGMPGAPTPGGAPNAPPGAGPPAAKQPSSAGGNDGGVSRRDVPSDMRDDMSSFQAEYPDESELPALLAKARALMHDGSHDSLRDALKDVLSERHAAAWYDYQERVEREQADKDLASWRNRNDMQSRVAATIDSALPGVSVQQSSGGSWYADYRGLKLRISDHPQVAGGGFNVGTGDRMGEADIQWIVDENSTDLPTAADIRKAVAEKLRDRDGYAHSYHFAEDDHLDNAARGARAAKRIVRDAAEGIAAISPEKTVDEILAEMDDILRGTKPAMQAVLGRAALADVVTATLDIADKVPDVEQRRHDDSPPDDRVSELLGDDDSGVRFPILDSAETQLRDAPIFVGQRFLQTAAAVQRGAFGITADLTESAVEDIRDVLADNIAGGLNREKFIADVSERLGAGSPLSEARLDTIFRANSEASTKRAMNDALNHWLVADHFPYRKYLYTRDSRVRESHKIMGTTGGLDGTGVYRADDPVWKVLQPPFAFGCRCRSAPLTVEGAARYGVQEAIDWLEAAKAYAADAGGDYSDYLHIVAPNNRQHVPWPELDGERIMPDPGFGDVSQFMEDAHGHEHKGKGPGGGQFTKKGASKATLTDPGEFSLKNPAASKPIVGDAKKKQQTLFAKSGQKNQMNLFSDKGVPDDLLPKHLKGGAAKPTPVQAWASKRFKNPEHAKAFVEWFGDSKVVDEKGEPLVVYHGTKADFDEFSKDKIKTRFSYSFGLHFTSRPSEADIYAVGTDPKFKPDESINGNVKPVYLRAVNPLTIETAQPTASMEADLNKAEIISQLMAAKRAGRPYDSVIITRRHGDEWDGVNAVVFDPSQIKSASGNRGTFDTTNSDIRFSETAHAPKGGVTIGGVTYKGGEFVPGKSQTEVDEAAVGDKGPFHDRWAKQISAGHKMRLTNGHAVHMRYDRNAYVVRHVGPDRKSTPIGGRFASHIQAADFAAAELYRRSRPATPATTKVAYPEWDDKTLPGLPLDPLVRHSDGRITGSARMLKSDIAIDPQRFQFKVKNIDPVSGITSEFSDVKFDPALAGTVQVWFDRERQKTYVVNGHHRLQIAQRDRSFNEPLKVEFIKAESAEEARGLGAFTNIAEGRGTATDAAKFMRDTGITKEDMAERNISLKGELLRNAIGLLALSDTIFHEVATGRMSEGRGVAMTLGGELKDHALQHTLWSEIKRQEDKRGVDVPDYKIREMAIQLAEAPKVTETQKGLFGDWEKTRSLLYERAEMISSVRKDLLSDLQAFTSGAKESVKAKLEKLGTNVLDTHTNAVAKQRAADMVATFDAEKNRRGPIGALITKAAEEFANAPQRRKEIIARLTQGIGEALSRSRDGAADHIGGG